MKYKYIFKMSITGKENLINEIRAWDILSFKFCLGHSHTYIHTHIHTHTH